MNKKMIQIKRYNDLKNVINKVKKITIFAFLTLMIIGSTRAYTKAELKEDYDKAINGMRIQTEQLLNENGYTWNNGIIVEEMN